MSGTRHLWAPAWCWRGSLRVGAIPLCVQDGAKHLSPTNMSRVFCVSHMTFNPRPEIFRAWMRNILITAFSIHSSVFLSLHRLNNEFSSRVSRFCSSIYLAYNLLFHTACLFQGSKTGGIKNSQIHCILFFQENAVGYDGFISGD